MSILCWLGLHRWSVWSKPHIPEIFYRTEVQTRDCVRCNLHQRVVT